MGFKAVILVVEDVLKQGSFMKKYWDVRLKAILVFIMWDLKGV